MNTQNAIADIVLYIAELKSQLDKKNHYIQKLERVKEAAQDVYESMDWDLVNERHVNIDAVEELIQALNEVNK